MKDPADKSRYGVLATKPPPSEKVKQNVKLVNNFYSFSVENLGFNE